MENHPNNGPLDTLLGIIAAFISLIVDVGVKLSFIISAGSHFAIRICKRKMLMKKMIVATAVAIACIGSTATSATLDFVAEADNNERGVVDGTVITMGGVDVEFNSSHFAYFDHGSAGLGVCKEVTDFSNGGTSNRCASGAGDDNVTMDEAVTISFTSAMMLSGLKFNEEGHKPFGTTTGSLAKTLLFATNGGALARYTFGELQAASFTDVFSATFAYDNSIFTVGDDRNLNANAEQYYLASAIVAPVPVPASLPLLLAGLGGLGFAARRKRKAA